ncbi:MAG: FAD-dependent oxidoreductase [Candidatus Campbellbacteria bacterium]|nr:FAD-dependent oxidoreductase [Candidatus Campbellbacteria bacterium]
MKVHPKKHIIIVGMGFAGLHAYLTLTRILRASDNIEITIVSATDSFTFIPMIHEVATGLLRPDSITYSLRNMVGPYIREFLEGCVTAVDLNTKQVTVALTEGISKNYSYDTLIMGIGSTTNFFNTQGAEEYALQLKSLDDAKHLKNKILSAFDDSADHLRIGKSAEVNVVVVGGGATGVELTGELSDFMELLSTTYSDVRVPHSITLLDGNDVLVKGAHTWISAKAQKILEHRPNVKVMLNTHVEKVTAQGVATHGALIPSTLTIWTAGVKASEVAWLPAGAVVVDERSRRIPVDGILRLSQYSDVYVLGDQALVRSTACQYPMRAQIAMKQGIATARNIVRTIRGETVVPFEWDDKGFILSLGEGGAVAEVRGVRFSGPLAWWVYRTAYLFTLVGIRAKLRTALEWTINLFTKRDISRI